MVDICFVVAARQSGAVAVYWVAELAVAWSPEVVAVAAGVRMMNAAAEEMAALSEFLEMMLSC